MSSKGPYTKKSILLLQKCSQLLIENIESFGYECGLLGEAARFAFTGEGPKVSFDSNLILYN
jgi:hypothetical protein